MWIHSCDDLIKNSLVMFPKAESTVHCAPSQLTPTQVYHIYFHSRQSDCHEQIRGCLYRQLELFHPGKNIALKKHNDPVSNHCSTALESVSQTVVVFTLIHPWYTRHQLDMDANYLPFLNTQQSSLSLVCTLARGLFHNTFTIIRFPYSK